MTAAEISASGSKNAPAGVPIRLHSLHFLGSRFDADAAAGWSEYDRRIALARLFALEPSHILAIEFTPKTREWRITFAQTQIAGAIHRLYRLHERNHEAVAAERARTTTPAISDEFGCFGD